MTSLTEKLTAYASGQLDDDGAEEIEALLIRYVDEDLDPQAVKEVEQVVGRHQTLATMIAESRAGKQWFEESLAPDLRPLFSNAPTSPELRQFVRDLTAESPPDAAIPVPSMSSVGSRSWYALAASIALALLIGGWSLQSTIRARIETAEADRARFEQELQQQRAGQEQRLAEIASLEDRVQHHRSELADAAAGRTSAEQGLAEAQKELQALRSERADLEQNLTRSLADLQTAAEQAEENTRLRAALDDAEAAKQAAAASSEQAIEGLDNRIADLTSALTRSQSLSEATDAKLAQSDLIIAAMRAEGDGQAEEMAKLRSTLEDRTASLEKKERDLLNLEGKVADLEVALSQATQQVAKLEIERRTAKAAGVQPAANEQPTWTKQVAGYYNLYARQPRRHLVEVRADESDHIEKWLGEQLGRAAPIPDLSEAGMDFQGARLLAINGMPVAQLTYLDAEGEPLAFCFMRNRKGVEKELELSSQDELHLVDWSDQAYQYVVVGSTTFATLEALAQGLGESYRSDI